MKRILFYWMLTAAITLVGQNHIPTLNTYTLAAGPNHVPSPTTLTAGTILWISDAQSATDCSSVGGGTTLSFCYVTNAHTLLAGFGGGGGMIWPGGGAGIPNYNGANGWGSSYSASNLIPLNFMSANVAAAITNDTNITGSISAQNLTLGWTGTLAAGRLNANVVQAITNDTNITGSISTQNLTLGWAGTLANARLTNPQTTVDGVTCTLGSTCSTPAVPVFSTAQTLVSMINSASTIIGSAVSMVASPVNGSTYRFVIQIVQTSPGVGTCPGTININLLYKDFDSGVTYGSNNALISFQPMAPAAGVVGSLAMSTAANGVSNNWTSVPKEFRVASGTAVQYQLFENAAIGGTCTTAPIFSARPALYGPLGY